MLEILLRIQPAAGHQGIGDADGGGGLKLDFDVEIIVLLQKRTVNDIAEVLLMLVPILTGQLSGHINKLLGKIVTGNAVVALQHGRHRPDVLFLQLPQPGGTGMFTGPGVGNIEHIAQPGPVAGIVYQGNTLGATAHIPAHFLIPQVVLGAGGGVRLLRVDQKLVTEIVLEVVGGGGQERHIVPAVGGNFAGLLRRKLYNGVQFFRHALSLRFLIRLQQALCCRGDFRDAPGELGDGGPDL